MWKQAQGEGSLIRKGQAIRIECIGGYPQFSGKQVFVKRGDSQNTLLIDEVPAMVTQLVWDEKGKRSLGKAAAGAIVGGVLTGGIGLIAGGAIGGKKKDASVAIISCTIDGTETEIYLSSDKDEFKKLSKILQQ